MLFDDQAKITSWTKEHCKKSKKFPIYFWSALSGRSKYDLLFDPKAHFCTFLTYFLTFFTYRLVVVHYHFQV